MVLASACPTARISVGRPYERILAPLGLARLVERSGAVGCGKRYPDLSFFRARLLSPRHWRSRVPALARQGAVRAFHAAALAGGCRDAGLPGPRHAAITMYFAAFVFDLDGNKVEAASFPRDPAQSSQAVYGGYGS